jgi:predicted glutamine amidotransferase
MCLAIFKPADAVLPEDSIREGWLGNSDGGGYAFVHKGKVVTRKGFKTLKDFLASYNIDSKKYKKSPFVVHFRIRSMGDRSAENTHPYPIAGGVLIHNGTLDGTGATYDKGESDTAKFCKMFGDKLTNEWVAAHKKELEQAVTYNKFVLLYDNGDTHIINESAGNWYEGVWYSNFSWKPRPVYTGGHGQGTGVMQ